MDDLRKQYNAIISGKELDDLSQEDEDKLDEIGEKAADLFTYTELQTKVDRKKIAHEEFEKNRPLSFDDFEAAADGNKEAVKKIKEESDKLAKQEQEGEVKSSQEKEAE